MSKTTRLERELRKTAAFGFTRPPLLVRTWEKLVFRGLGPGRRAGGRGGGGAGVAEGLRGGREAWREMDG